MDLLVEPVLDDTPPDLDMIEETHPIIEIESSIPAAATETGENGENGLPFQDDPMDEAPARVTYIDYLRSPVIGLLVGQGDEQALLTAHQALLVQSPWFADACANFSEEVSVCRFPPFTVSKKHFSLAENRSAALIL